MTNIFVSSDETKVIGGTETVNVEVDFGPQGDRGNLFLVGYGNPNIVNHAVDINLLDIYINIQSTDEDYLVIYQYISNAGNNAWVSAGKLMTDKFSTNKDITFVNGISSIGIDFKVSNIIPLSLVGGLTADDFNIQCTFSGSSKPIASSLTISPITIQSATGDVIFTVYLNAVEYFEGAWTPLNRLVTAHFLITVV